MRPENYKIIAKITSAVLNMPRGIDLDNYEKWHNNFERWQFTVKTLQLFYHIDKIKTF